MRNLRRLFSLAGICLTAFMTLVAGMPHFHCVCPDGRVKPFCLSFFSRTSCCADSCCPASTTGDEEPPRKQTSCCCQASRQPSGDQEQQVRAAGCKKSLVDAEASNVTAPVRNVGQDAGMIVWVAPSETAVVTTSMAGQLTPHYHLSPPPDLITLLQHFNI
jgi:hypothetical protein